MDKITISCKDHHEQLVDALWKSLTLKSSTDFNVKWGKKLIRAHSLILNLFLSPIKLTLCSEFLCSDNDFLLEFLYKGSVTLPKSRLHNLMRVAEACNFEMLVDAISMATQDAATATTAATEKKVTVNDGRSKVLFTKRVRSRYTQTDQTQSPVPPDDVTGKKVEVIETPSKLFRFKTVVSQASQTDKIKRLSTLGDATSKEVEPDETPPELLRLKTLVTQASQTKTIKNLSLATLTKKIENISQASKNETAKIDQASQLPNPKPCLKDIVDLGDMTKPSQTDKIKNLPLATPTINVEKIYQASKTEIAKLGQTSQLPNPVLCLNDIVDFGEITNPCYPIETENKIEHSQDKPDSRSSLEVPSALTQQVQKDHNTNCGLCRQILEYTEQKDTILGKNGHQCDMYVRQKNANDGSDAVDKSLSIFECIVCHKSYPMDDLCVKHRQRHKRVLLCNVCGVSFLNASKLKSHMLDHRLATVMARARDRRAANIPPSFSAKQRIYYRRKNAEKKIVCEICGFRFKYLAYLKTHQRCHTGEKPYKCDYESCDKAFSTSSALIKHKMIHTNARPFPCNICCKSFRNKIHLQIHMRSHTGERPYKCNLCDLACTTNGNLRAHLLTHAKGPTSKRQTKTC